eukprot:m.60335 g.60335  ORF g.60335 m.60335 type:complete len:137 (+) comp13079_c0_seq4:1462-1872(+)
MAGTCMGRLYGRAGGVYVHKDNSGGQHPTQCFLVAVVQAAQLKSGALRFAPSSSVAGTAAETPPAPVAVTASAASPEAFTQEQQRALEDALRAVPSSDSERWDKIAQLVKGKSKADCIARYKAIVAKLKSKRASAN